MFKIEVMKFKPLDKDYFLVYLELNKYIESDKYNYARFIYIYDDNKFINIRPKYFLSEKYKKILEKEFRKFNKKIKKEINNMIDFVYYTLKEVQI